MGSADPPADRPECTESSTSPLFISLHCRQQVWCLRKDPSLGLLCLEQSSPRSPSGLQLSPHFPKPRPGLWQCGFGGSCPMEGLGQAWILLGKGGVQSSHAVPKLHSFPKAALCPPHSSLPHTWAAACPLASGRVRALLMSGLSHHHAFTSIPSGLIMPYSPISS